MAAVVVTGELACKSDRLALWRVIGDTDRVKRAAGAGGMDVRPLEGKGAARFAVTTRAGPLTLELDELPYEWVEGERLVGKQLVTRGPVREIVADIRLTSVSGGGTKAWLSVSVEPKGLIGGFVAKAVAKRVVADWLGVVRKADEALARGESPFAAIAPRPPPPAAALDRAGEELLRLVTPARAALARRLVDFVRTADEGEVSHIRPFELADAWGADRREVVTVCLAAVVAGLLDLRWGIVCPSCEQAAEVADDLSAIGAEGHCHLCDLSYGVDFERAVEATFRPAAAARVVDARPRCIGGPSRTPHVVAQALLGAGATVSLAVPARAGRYRLFLRGGAVATVEAADGAPAEVDVRAGQRLEPAQLSVAPGGSVRVTSAVADERHVKLERSEFAARAATAHFVATIPAFRRLFSGQTVKPGLLLKVSRAALLFTDLAGSTALYTSAGDATAFRVVMDHFDLLRDEVERHKGAIVKTIGDSVMAVFLDDADACRGAVAMVRAFADYRARTPDAASLALRVGVHSGPVYAVNANKLLDYFGQTVNVAARLQSQARPDEVVMDAQLAATADAGGWLPGAEVTERFECSLKGLDGVTHAARVRSLSSSREPQVPAQPNLLPVTG